jgi:repressor of nif and glnA expression
MNYEKQEVIDALNMAVTSWYKPMRRCKGKTVCNICKKKRREKDKVMKLIERMEEKGDE